MTKKHLRQMIQDQEQKIDYLICMLYKGSLQFCMTKKQTTRMFEQELKYLDDLKRQYKYSSPNRVTFVEA
jgi:aminopeptidase-like protein